MISASKKQSPACPACRACGSVAHERQNAFCEGAGSATRAVQGQLVSRAADSASGCPGCSGHGGDLPYSDKELRGGLQLL